MREEEEEEEGERGVTGSTGEQEPVLTEEVGKCVCILCVQVEFGLLQI